MSEAKATEARQPGSVRMRESWTVRTETVMYAATAIGYLYAIFSPHGQLRWSGVLLLTISCVLWVAIFRYIIVQTTSRYIAPAFAGLIAVSLLAQVAAFMGVQLDWLAPVLTVGVIAAALPLIWAVVISAAITATTWVIIGLLGGPGQQHMLAAIWNGMTVVSAFAFAFIFSICLSALENQRNTAEHLLTQLEEAHEQLRAHAKEAEALAVAEERNRMAREIHDTLGHYLTILAVELETALKLEEHGDARLRSQLIGARRVATECLTEVRHSVAALRPTDPSTLALDAALARLRAEFAAALPDTEITLDIEGPIQTLTPELRVALYRCAQESLTNIRKHAHATKALIRVRMRMDAREVEMTILDNGVGDDACGDGHEPGFGLLGMRERIALLGGAAMARPEPERGWRVEARVPLTPPASRCPANDIDHELTAASVGGVN